MDIQSLLTGQKKTTLYGTPAGVDGMVLAQMIDTLKNTSGGKTTLLVIARDDRRLDTLQKTFDFFAPDKTVWTLPAWDCLPYDRISPHRDVVASRLHTLCRLASGDSPDVLLTTGAAVMGRLIPAHNLKSVGLTLQKNGSIDIQDLGNFLQNNGYERVSTVREAGEYAIRGDIVDIFPSGHDTPVRIDIFGDDIEKLRIFDALSQRTTGEIETLSLLPVSEVFLNETTTQTFRSQYRSAFGAVENDPLYESIKEGRVYAGMEHWLPFFYKETHTLFDYMPNVSVIYDDGAQDVMLQRWDDINDYYTARYELMQSAGRGDTPYRPVPIEQAYITAGAWDTLVADYNQCALNAYSMPDGADNAMDAGGRMLSDFAEARTNPDTNIYQAVKKHLQDSMAKNKIIATYSTGSRERLQGLFNDYGAGMPTSVDTFADVLSHNGKTITTGVIPLERGFRYGDICLTTEQDILGDRLFRTTKKRRRSDDFLTEVSALETGDIVVHVEHGIGRYQGLETVTVNDAPHDCLLIQYAGDDRLFVPVENIDILSKYGNDSDTVQLDKLGGAGWQMRKGRLKERIRIMADQLIKIAAERKLQKGAKITITDGTFEEFSARFPYMETDDQLTAIEDVLADLSSGNPMDRLVCGDVGFGKTEVAMRAVFLAAMAGYQVAIVVPTTLLSRQHYNTFAERFKGLPIRIAQLSRMTKPTLAKQIKDDLKTGQVDVVIGTHGLLHKSIEFSGLGLLVIDEEQHFGVGQKERLKQMKSNVHVLTLTATPIPRTLQMALSGVRELSLMTTPPMDRLAVRTFVMPYDDVVIREAILRERNRGGQTYYVCPRLTDLPEVKESLQKLVPDVRVAIAHGQLPATELDKIMTDFTDGKYDVLLATNIVESGLDISTANTMIIHRANMFGLAQLYQLRGRIGRSKLRAYCYLTTQTRYGLTDTAIKRLEVMQTLDSLGGGFSVASHDLDIRGAGNIVGDEQSGHIKEVGVELYQSMLEDAVAHAKERGLEGANSDGVPDDGWSPSINVGMSILIPEEYISDLNVRLSLYRRLGALKTRTDIDSFAAEMIDRFGKLPESFENLLTVTEIKQLCKIANVEKVDAGAKGVVLSLRNNEFPQPTALMTYIQDSLGTAKVRPDQKIVVARPWKHAVHRLKGVLDILREITALIPQNDSP